MVTLADYRPLVGDDVYYEIFSKMRRMYGKRLINVNSTFMGGGVAEILNSLAPLMNDIGLVAGWQVVHGNPDFFAVTKQFHNALQGDPITLSNQIKDIYLQVNQRYSTYTHLENQDMVIIHDPQPLPLIMFNRKRQPWIWRCHIDLSTPNKELWQYLREFILQYDLIILSSEQYLSKDLPMEYRIIQPSIDPLSMKNAPMSPTEVSRILKKYNVPEDKPLVTQVSRFDKWKDPFGVYEVYRKIREEVPCRLVLCGSMASDDPEGIEIFDEVKKAASRDIASGDVILLAVESNILVNALQRASAVIIQKSQREGFGLTVTEAMWKERPVIASNVGGIPLQIEDGVNGFLCRMDDAEAFAARAVEILKNPELGAYVGRKARETVQQKFLITRSIISYLNMLKEFQ